MDDQTHPDHTALLLDRYRVETVVGEGAFGRVVRAFDTRLKRFVAVKTLKRSAATVDPLHFRVLQDRFVREAEAGSRVGSHPNVVTVYDLATDAEQSLYLILEYVGGGTLAEFLRDHRTLPLPDALRWATDVARGLRAAHDAGIVHRDVKPANIFLATDDRAQLGDFGIAQLDHLSGRTYATIGHPGTPLYMSPEQARMTGYIRPDADQYSLGLVLFEMLVGVPYKRLREREAAASVAAFPAPIAALFHQMAAETADDRYASMDEVIERIATAARATGGDGPIVRPGARPTSERPRRGTTESLSPGEGSAATVPGQTALPGTALPDRTLANASDGALPPPPPTMSRAPELPDYQPRLTRRRALLLCSGIALAGGTAATGFLVSRGGDPATGTQRQGIITTPSASAVIESLPLPTSTATPNPTPALVTAAPAPPSPTPAPTLVVLRRLTGHTDRVYTVAFSPDGNLLASGSGDTTVRLWRVEDGAPLRTLSGHTDIVSSVLFAPVGTLLGSTSFDKTIRLWSASDGAPIRTLSGHTHWVRGLAFTPDAQIVASASDDKTVRLWQVKEGMPIRTLSGHDELVSCVAISPDGRILASGSIDKTIRLWQVSDGAPLKTLIGHTDLVTTVRFSPDGKILASAGAPSASGAGDASVRLWSMPDGALLHTLVGHTDGVIGLGFAPDGGTLVTSSMDKTVRFWRMPDGAPLTTLRGPTDLTYSVVYAPDSRLFASGAEDNTARLWQVK